MKRTVILVEKNLSPREVANVSAICMGHVGKVCKEIFSEEPIYDLSENRHVAIKYSCVILKCGSVQLMNFATNFSHDNALDCIALFSRTGMMLNNAFDEYKHIVVSSVTDKLDPIGLVVVGNDEDIRKMTKKFSVYQ